MKHIIWSEQRKHYLNEWKELDFSTCISLAAIHFRRALEAKSNQGRDRNAKMAEYWFNAARDERYR